MPVYQLDERIAFPRPQLADEDGLLAIGGDLRPERLLLAYAHGIFPWYSEGVPILWHSPDPRMVLEIGKVHMSRSLRKAIRRGTYEIKLDTAFRRVVGHCATVDRPDHCGTWITNDMTEAYSQLHDLGFAHSAEAWRDGRLVGGVYGVSLGSLFFGESMFALEPDASKVAFVALVEQLADWGLELVDCQVHTEHLERFGAVMWPRERYLDFLADAMVKPTLRGTWRLGATAVASD